MAGLYRILSVLLLSSTVAAQVSAPSISVPSILCTDTPVTFSASVGTNMQVRSYTWTVLPVTAKPESGTNDATSTYNFVNPGTYQVRLGLTDTSNAVFTATRSVVVSRSAKAAFNASLSTAGYPNELLLTNYSSNYLSTYWIFNDQADADSATHTVKQYTRPGSYTVTLVSVGRNGCNNALQYEFVIPDLSGVTLPNIFTPNNDGVNDVYRPIARGISSLGARVISRTGVTMASWDRVNGFWDGRTTSGELCDEGVYFVVVEAVGFDGRNFSQKGTITLVR
jgi:gliding motility-associated-like protein